MEDLSAVASAVIWLSGGSGMLVCGGGSSGDGAARTVGQLVMVGSRFISAATRSLSNAIQGGGSPQRIWMKNPSSGAGAKSMSP
jgi:hypothetical protein